MSDGQLMYIGKTVRTLATRMQGYQKPGLTQLTNQNNHKNYVVADTEHLKYRGFDVNLAAGLEDGLILKLQPPWNGGQKETSVGTMEPTESPIT